MWKLLEKVVIELPYDPAAPLLGRYPKIFQTFIHRNTCNPTFIAELFMVAKTWKQQKYLSIDDWIKKVRYIYIRWNILLSYNRR